MILQDFLFSASVKDITALIRQVSFSSATAVRGVISTLIDIDKHNSITNMQLDNSWISTRFSQLIPSACTDILVNCILGGHIVFPDDISEMLYYRLLTGKDKGFAQYADCTKELSAKIVKNIYKYEGFTQFCNLLKSKNLTYTRISRVLTHILLGIENNDFNICMDNPYLRILGFKKSSGELMHLLKKEHQRLLLQKSLMLRTSLFPRIFLPLICMADCVIHSKMSLHMGL